MRGSIFFAVFMAVLLIFFGCTAGESSGGVGGYIGLDSDFALVYSDDVTVSCCKRGRVVSGVIDGTGMGFEFDLDAKTCSVSVGGAVIPLSDGASADLAGVLAAVFPLEFESGYAGEVLFLDSVVNDSSAKSRVLLENGLPISVEVGGKIIEIHGFKIVETGETDETQERGLH